MTSPERPCLRHDEQLITALVPARLVGGRPPTPAPLPMLPALGLPAATEPGDLLIETARLDASGGLTARPLLRGLGWGVGHRVDIAVTEGVLVVGSTPAGLHVVGDRGELGHPAPECRMCGLTPGPPVLLVAALPHDVLVVHPDRSWVASTPGTVTISPRHPPVSSPGWTTAIRARGPPEAFIAPVSTDPLVGSRGLRGLAGSHRKLLAFLDPQLTS